MPRRPLIPHVLRTSLPLIAFAAIASFASSSATAQSAFSPAITVNDSVVSYYEIDQRARLLAIMSAPGDVEKLAREQLVEDRLKLQAAREFGIAASEDGIQSGINNFAQRVNMNAEDLIRALAVEGVDEETLRDFLSSQIVWGAVVNARFGANAEVTEEEIDRSIAQNSGAGGVRVLLSEIVVPVTPQSQRQVLSLTTQISELESYDEFENAARIYSQAGTKDDGGRLDWINIVDLPPELRPSITALRPGQITTPIQLPNAVALFQMRGIAETGRSTPSYSAIDYAMYLLPGGRSEDTLKEAADIRNKVDRCDDLYGIAKGETPERLVRENLPPNEIPSDIALELAKLDDNEISTTLTTASGQSLMMLMLCGRTAVLGEELSREDVAIALRDSKLQGYAQSYLNQLQAQARITTQ